MSAAELLKLIEEVAPSDNHLLDEIDARVWCFRENVQFDGMDVRLNGQPMFKYIRARDGQHRNGALFHFDKYSRSRDALKWIRPKDWTFKGGDNRSVEDWQDEKPVFVYIMEHKDGFTTEYVKDLPTEELAELHAIIQAIEYERGLK